jgi:hypothetical protein
MCTCPSCKACSARKAPSWPDSIVAHDDRGARDTPRVGGGERFVDVFEAVLIAEQAAYMLAQSERYRAAWRLAWDFPQPEPEPEPDTELHGGEQAVDALADRWLAELDRYGIDRIGFATGGGNDTLARAVARHPQRFIGFAHHDPFSPGAADELHRAVTDLGLRGLKILAPALERRIDNRDLYLSDGKTSAALRPHVHRRGGVHPAPAATGSDR